MAEASKCPHCGKPVPPGTPGGLCPECLVKVGIGSEAGGPKREAEAPPSPEEVARHFPQLEIIELLGSGGMGAVYKARQREIDRLVALKILPLAAGSDPGFAERFAREARALAKLSHPNIVALHEFGHVNGLHYFIMEFVDGLNLRQLEQAGRLSPREALQIIPQICEALQFAHDEGIVHRDIKPENVLLDKKGRVKIADFGLARILGHEPEDFRLTRAREVMGTPHYMAPEQVEKPQSVDHRADIYSLGVVFYEMLTGELPLGKFAPPSQKVQIDVRLDEVVLRALEKEPARRYQHASEVKTDMETIMARQPEPTAGTPFALPGSQASRKRLALRRFIAVTAGVAATLAICFASIWWLGHRATAQKPGTPSLIPETNADSAQAASEAFVRRYGLRPPGLPAAPSPEPEAGPAQDAATAFARRYGLRGPGPPSPPSPLGTNVSFSVVATGTAPLSYQWQSGTNGTTGVASPGPEGLVITKLTPLYLKLTLDDVIVTDSGPRYKIGVENEAALSPRERGKRQKYCRVGDKNEAFAVREIKAPPDNPTNATMVLELNEIAQRVEVDKDHPYRRIAGYAADLKFEPEHKTWPARRVGGVLSFGGDDYEIMAITRTAVVLRQKSNNKTWAVEYSGPPGGPADASPKER